MALPSKVIAIDPGVMAQMRGQASQAAQNALLNEDRRIVGVDTTNWMGPLNPLQPFAPPGTGWRAWDYPVGINIRYIPRQEEPDLLIGFDELRFFSYNVDPVRIIIENRKQQLQRQDWRFTLADSSKDPDDDPRIKLLTEFFQEPDRVGGMDFPTWLNVVLEQMLTIDAACCFIERDKKGNAAALPCIDGASIKVLVDQTGRQPEPPSPSYQQIIKGVPVCDLDKSQLFYYPRNARPDGLYGYSPVEAIITTLNLWMRREIYRLQFFTNANIPAGLIELPQNFTNEDVKDYKRWLESSLRGNTAERWNMLPVPNGAKYTEIKAPILQDALDEYIMQIVCYTFGVPPTPFMAMRGGMARANMESQKDQSKEEGLAPLIQWLGNFVNRLVYRGWGWNDIRFGPVFAKETDPQIQANIHKTYLSLGVLNINEVRDDLGRDPIEGGDEYRIYEASGPIPIDNADQMADAAVQSKQLGLKGQHAALQAGAQPNGPNNPAGKSQNAPDDNGPNTNQGGAATARAGTRTSPAKFEGKVFIVGHEADQAIAKARQINFGQDFRKKKVQKSRLDRTVSINTLAKRKLSSRLY